LFVGTHRIWRSPDGGASWASLSPKLTGAGAGAIVRGFAVAPGHPQTMYATTSDGRVQRSLNGGGAWARRDTGLPGAPILDPTVSPYDSNLVFVASTNPGGGQVFKTTNGGGAWSNLTGNLPSALMALSLAADFESVPTRLFVGTDVGLYVSDD